MKLVFENDVKIYGIKTTVKCSACGRSFENDVKIYGIKTRRINMTGYSVFENDVKIYGIKTHFVLRSCKIGLRMM